MALQAGSLRWAVYSNQSKMADGNPFPFPVHEAGSGFGFRLWGFRHFKGSRLGFAWRSKAEIFGVGEGWWRN